MITKLFAGLCIALGLLAAVITLALDPLRGVEPHLGILQWFTVIGGVAAAVAGILLLLRPEQTTASLLKPPPLFWFGLAFMVIYAGVYLEFTFFTADRMQFPEFIPAFPTKGTDIEVTLEGGKAWLEGGSPYEILYYYTPLAVLAFTPLAAMPFPDAYLLLSMLTFTLFVACGLVFPLLVDRSWKHLGIYLLFTLTGLAAYGFNFEIERGQFNVISLAFVLGAIYLFYRHPRLRWLSFVLLTVAAQLKLYPAIFGAMLLTYWKDWRTNLKTVLSIGALNILALFVMGPAVFVDWLDHLTHYAERPYTWHGNHSITSFISLIESDRAAILSPILLAVYGVCLITVLVINLRTQDRQIDPLLLFVLTIGAMVIPSVSHDYKLTLLIAPTALLIAHLTEHRSGGIYGVIEACLIFVFGLAYCLTLYSYMYKTWPDLLQNNFLPLLAMTLIVTALTVMRRLPAVTRASEPALP